MTSFEDYVNILDDVYTENPVISIEALLGNNDKIKPTDLIKLTIAIKQQWENYKKHNIQMCIIVNDDNVGNDTLDTKIDNYDFGLDIREILRNGKETLLYIIDINGVILDKVFKDKCIPYNSLARFGKKTNKVTFYMGINGVDVLINGVPLQTDNHFDSYKDVIGIRFLSSIKDYNKLLNNFFHTRVQYDPMNNYFLNKNDTPKEWHQLIQDNPKLLKVKPEERFQKNLEQFLKDYCTDRVIDEVRNRYGERYDIWVSTNEDKIYVIEIKWLGKSITISGNIFDAYNNSERAVDGAKQLIDYVDNADVYMRQFGEFNIHCGILVVFDAREEMLDLNFPSDVDKYPQLDLTQHYKIEKSKVSASEVGKVNRNRKSKIIKKINTTKDSITNCSM